MAFDNLALTQPNIQPADIINNDDPSLLKLHLGCGKNYMSTWINVDNADVKCDLNFSLEMCQYTPFPYADNSIDVFYCAHTLEHIRNILPLMQELHRIAKPNAYFLAIVPHGSNDAAYEDPTHKRHFFNKSFYYFGQSMYAGADYGYRGDWKVESLYLTIRQEDLTERQESLVMRVMHQRNYVQDFAAIMRAVKPIRTNCVKMDVADVYFLKVQ